MSTKEVERFIMFYERITRHNLKTHPEYADMILKIDENHKFSF